jgi:hypothetical protein
VKIRGVISWVVIGILHLVQARAGYAENIPLLEYYETSSTTVVPTDDKYEENRKAESITFGANLMAPVYTNEKGGLIANLAFTSLVRSEFVDKERVADKDNFFRSQSVLKAGFISYGKLNETFTPIVMANYFNHPSAAAQFKPMFDFYLGSVVRSNYTGLLRIVHHPHGFSYTPLVGWKGALSDTWTLDVLLPAHCKFIYTASNKRYIWTTGAQADSRDYPVEVNQEKGWLTGYHVKAFSQLSLQVYKALYLSVTPGLFYTVNKFYPYQEKKPKFAFYELPTPFFGLGFEANL